MVRVANAGRQQVVYSINNSNENNSSDGLLDYETAVKHSKIVTSQRFTNDNLPTYEEFLTKISN